MATKTKPHPKFKLTSRRAKVYFAVNTERAYQESLLKDPSRPDILENFSVGDALSAIQYNLDQARNAWYRDSKPYKNTTEYLRKIAGIIVQVGEQYGMPERK